MLCNCACSHQTRQHLRRSSSVPFPVLNTATGCVPQSLLQCSVQIPFCLLRRATAAPTSQARVCSTTTSQTRALKTTATPKAPMRTARHVLPGLSRASATRVPSTSCRRTVGIFSRRGLFGCAASQLSRPCCTPLANALWAFSSAKQPRPVRASPPRKPSNICT